jgi:hypothetical protein
MNLDLLAAEDPLWVMTYLGSSSKVSIEDSPCRVQVLPSHHTQSPAESRALLELLRGKVGGIGRVARVDRRTFDAEAVLGPDGELWAGPGGLTWVIDSPEDLRRLAAFIRQHAQRLAADPDMVSLLAGRYLSRADLLEELAAEAAAQGKLLPAHVGILFSIVA